MPVSDDNFGVRELLRLTKFARDSDDFFLQTKFAGVIAVLIHVSSRLF